MKIKYAANLRRRGSVALAAVVGLSVAILPATTAGSGAASSETAPSSATVAGTADSSSFATTSAAVDRPASAQQRLPASSTVTLATGQRVRLDATSAGPPSVTLLPTHATDGSRPEAATFTQFQWAGDTYVVPNVVAPYLGSTLDIRLFDVSYLVRAKLDDKHSSTLPVTVTYRQRQATRLPAIRADEAANRKADARIVKSDALALGRLLSRRWQAAEDGRPTEAVGRLDAVARISLAPSGDLPKPPTILSSATTSSDTAQASAASGPAFHTITLDPIAPDGDPGVAIGFVQNVDDARLSLSGPSSSSGLFVAGGGSPTSFSVPEGTYSITTTVLDGPVDDFSVASAFVAKPEVTVDSDTTITLDARDAVPFVSSLQPPLEAPEFREDILTFTRTSEQGGDRRVQPFGGVALLSMRLISEPGQVDIVDNGILSATPTESISKGSFDFAAFTQLAQDPTDATSPQSKYLLAFPTEGRIPDSLTYSVSESDLTVVHSELYGSDPLTRQSVTLFLPWSIWNSDSLVFFGSRRLHPGELVDYWYSSAPDITFWQEEVHGGSTSFGPRRRIVPGEEISDEWLKGPLVPSPVAPYVDTPAGNLLGGGQDSASDPLAAVCTACRQDDNGMVYLRPLGDSEPMHFGGPEILAVGSRDLATSGVAFYRDGELAFAVDHPAIGALALSPDALDLPLLPKPADYRFDWTYTPKADPAAATTTSWRFHSGPEDPSAELPSSVQCAPDASRDCSLLPLLFVTYDLPLSHTLTAPAASPFELAFRVGGQQSAPAPTGVEATVSVSYDDGQTWTEPRAATPQGDGTFALPVQHPPLSETTGYVSLRVRAHDAAGNSIEQTLIHAYALEGQ